MAKKRRSFIITDEDYAKLKAEKARRNQDGPSTDTLSDIVHDCVEHTLPEAPKPQAAKVKKKPGRTQRREMLTPAIA